MHTLFFGTFDERTHPRVAVLREGLGRPGASVEVVNVPLGLSTDDRVRIARRPWLVPVLLVRIAMAWARLLHRSRGVTADVVVVGYLGHFDVHLARRRFPSAVLVLDHMVGLGDTVRDRGLDGRSRLGRVLDRIDRAAVRTADLVVIDTEEQAELLPADVRARAVVVPVGSPTPWFVARRPLPASDHLRIVFFGLYTPLQGAPAIAEAIRSIPSTPLAVTMVGQGQELDATRATLAGDGRVTWIDWADADELPGLVARHDVCLGIFGTSPKALRVVPNKVFQGAAAGCALVTSDTTPQRRVLDGAALLVPPDATALADALASLAAEPALVARYRAAAGELADRRFRPNVVVQPLLERLEAIH